MILLRSDVIRFIINRNDELRKSIINKKSERRRLISERFIKKFGYGHSDLFVDCYDFLKKEGIVT